MANRDAVPDSHRRTVASLKLAPLLKMLSNVINDRQPDSQKQTPDTEWRRQRDAVASLNTVRDVLAAVIEMLQGGQASALSQRGQILVNDGNGDVPLDPPRGQAAPMGAILVYDPTSLGRLGGLKWDGDLFQQIQDCCG